jgi:hypothetical protein
MNWEQSKIIFNHIIKSKYVIRKDLSKNDILYISWKKLNVKCKYFLAFVVNEMNEILWSCDNIFIDNKTQFLSKHIKTLISADGIDNKKFDKKFASLIKKIFESNDNIKYMEERINLIWVVTGTQHNYKYYYVITEIIYL